MNTKQKNEDKIYVYSSFKQFCTFACSWVSSAVAIYKLGTEKLFRSGNAEFCKLIINYTSI